MGRDDQWTEERWVGLYFVCKCHVWSLAELDGGRSGHHWLSMEGCWKSWVVCLLGSLPHTQTCFFMRWPEEEVWLRAICPSRCQTRECPCWQACTLCVCVCVQRPVCLLTDRWGQMREVAGNWCEWVFVCKCPQSSDGSNCHSYHLDVRLSLQIKKRREGMIMTSAKLTG